MDPATFQRLHPRTYMERFLKEGFRPDGREPHSWRNASVNSGSITTAEGSALARIGDTTVVCGIKAEIAEPDLAEPGHGFLVPNLDLPAICSPRFKPGPPGEEAQVFSQRLYQTLTSSGMLPLESLCIEPGKAVWVLYIDATCINYDGNVFDTALLAVISALFNARLPKATYSSESQRTTVSPDEVDALAIDPSRIPFSFTFGTFSSSHASQPALLVDPSSFEEPLLQSTIAISVLPNGLVCSTLQTGGSADTGLEEDAMITCLSAAIARLPSIQRIVESQLK